MPRGPAPKPAAVREAQGDAGKRGEKAVPVDTTPPSLETPPSWLSDEAKALWREEAPAMIREGRLKETDRMAFGRFLEMTVLWLRLKEEIEGGTLCYESSSNHGKLLRQHPNLGNYVTLERVLQAGDDRFGRNPSYRQQLYQRMAGQPPGAPGPLFGRDDAPSHDPASDLDELIGADRVH